MRITVSFEVDDDPVIAEPDIKQIMKDATDFMTGKSRVLGMPGGIEPLHNTRLKVVGYLSATSY